MMTPSFLVPTTSFVGRNEELARIASLLAEPNCRLLTLLGPGGIGKTRLAFRVSTNQSSFTDGNCFVPLTPLSSPDLLPSTIASALQLTFRDTSNLRLQLANYLREKQMLLVLDNFEHLLDGVDLLTDLLQAAPELKFLVTSRERLNVQEEWILVLEGLSVPTDESNTSLESHSAVQLFAQRARQVQVNFSLGDHAPAVRMICQQVEGMPLGLELAATWLRVMSPQQIVAQIENSLTFLTTSLRNVPERHRSLSAVFEQSWQLLSEEEQRVFRRLSICRGFDRKAAQDFGVSLPMLSSLINKSLLTHDENGRFHIHELLRQYAAELLMELPTEHAAARTLHGEYFWAFLNDHANGLYTSRKPEVLSILDIDIENIFMAWAWAVSEQRHIEIQRLAPALYRYLWNRRLYQFGEETFSHAIAALEQNAASQEQEVTLAVLLYTQSRFYWRSANFVRAADLARRALALLRPYDCPREIAHALFHVAVPSNDGAERIALLHESLALCRTVDEPLLTATVLLFLAEYEQGIGQFGNAKDYNVEALAIARQLGNFELLEGALGFRIKRGLLQKQYEAVYADALEALDVAYSCSIWDAASALNNLGHITAGLEKVAEAEHYYHKSLALSLEGVFMNTAMESLLGMGCLLTKCGQAQQAAELLGCVFAQIAQNSTDENRQFYFVTPNFSMLLADLPSDILAEARESRVRPDLLIMASHVLKAGLVLQDNANHQPSRTPPAVSSLKKTHPSIEPLTIREAEILRMIADGDSNQEIAERLVISVTTVKKHINHIFGKLGVNSRTQALARAQALHLL